jgi:hypothetical protein
VVRADRPLPEGSDSVEARGRTVLHALGPEGLVRLDPRARFVP